MIPKIGADVAHTEPAFAGLQLLRVFIGGLVKHIDLARKKIAAPYSALKKDTPRPTKPVSSKRVNAVKFLRDEPTLSRQRFPCRSAMAFRKL